MIDFIKKLAAKLRSVFFLIIFPKRCLNCGNFDSYFCIDCQKKLKYLLEKKDFNLEVYSIFAYDEPGISSLIHAFKYKFIEEVFIDLESMLLAGKDNLLKFLPKSKGRIYYLAVPLNKKRLRERSYNQSEKLAKIWQKIYPGKILNDIVYRQRYTKNQASLGRKERLINLKGIFSLNENFDFSLINQNDILFLVDDVVTTGSTLEEIYFLLKEKWPGKIVGLTLARD